MSAFLASKDRLLKIEEHLILARRHVAEAEARVERQAQTVVTLRRDGHEEAAAAGERLLGVFEQSLNLMLAHLEMEEAELERLRAEVNQPRDGAS